MSGAGMGGGLTPNHPKTGLWGGEVGAERGKGGRGGSYLICHLGEVPFHGVGILAISVIFGFHFTDPKQEGDIWGGGQGGDMGLSVPPSPH